MSCPRETSHRENLNVASDNAPSHTALSVNEFWAKKNITLVPKPPYSPDLSSCDYFLFPILKKHLKEHIFRTIENIKKFVTEQLKEIPVSEFQHCYEAVSYTHLDVYKRQLLTCDYTCNMLSEEE